jgi:hypothetical protein
VENLSRFFRIFYEKSYSGGSAGILVQHLPMIQIGLIPKSRIPVPWLSDRKLGPYGELFADLEKRLMKQSPAPYSGETAPELLVSGLAPDHIAILLPQDPDLDDAVGTRADEKGTAWIVAPRAGSYRLYYRDGSRPIQTQAQHLPSKPGYDSVERINIKSRRQANEP